MGLFSKKPKTVRYVLLPGGNAVEIVGESHYQAALEQVAGGKTDRATEAQAIAYLVREPDNPFDRNAVAVYILGQKVGHLSRDDAEEYAPLLDELWEKEMVQGCCVAQLKGGWKREVPSSGDTSYFDEGDFGVVLGLAEPEMLIGEYTLTVSDTPLATYEEWVAQANA